MNSTGFVTLTDATTGKVRVLGKNIITFSGDDLAARVLAGQSEYRPTHVGFVYGADEAPAEDFANPASTREHPWTDVRAEVLAAGANIFVAPITATGVAPGDADHGANTVSFHSSSGAGFEYAFTPNSGGFADTLPNVGTVHYYQLLLLNRRMVSNIPTYTVFARKAIPKVADVYVGVDDADAQMVVWALTIALASA